MKKSICILASLIIILSLCSCGTAAPDSDSKVSDTPAVQTAENTVDVDLTTLSSTMVYSEVYNMLTNPADYTDKTVKMKGSFSVYTDSVTGKNYFACLIADATACCSQGIEFVLDGDYVYPQDYPELGTEITVTGTFGTYLEGENTYCQLSDAVMVL